MAEHKRQHGVPKCHLKYFSVDEAGKAINLLNIQTGRLIANAPIKTQCAKNYLYGTDLRIEKKLQAPEGRYASIVATIATAGKVDDYALRFLRDFCYLQYLRTEVAARRQFLAQTEFVNLALERVPNEKRPAALTEEDFVREAINTFADTVESIDDLKVCLLVNKSGTSFVTSDDPAILINRFYAQRLGPRWSSFGISNAGVILLLPLSPTHMVCGYDGDLYTCPDKTANIIELTKSTDIDALNVPQFLKAHENVYFSDWAQRDEVKSKFNSVTAKRPKTWHYVHYAVKDESSADAASGSQRYRVVHTEEERLAASEAFIHIQGVMLDPGVWCSKIKFRDRPIFIDTQSGAGYKRRPRH